MGATMIYALAIEFIGTRYRGWQRQRHLSNTLQETLEAALSKVADEPIELIAAGRTDAGVHASHMLAHFSSNAKRDSHQWLRGTNSLLPDDIALKFIVPMPDDFHARFCAIARRYHYITLNRPHRPAILAGQITHYYPALDIKAMQSACTQLLGWHDFTSFRAAACQSNRPTRHVMHASLSQVGQLLIFDIKADGFLHHMVRNIMGVLFAIGEHKLPQEAIAHLLTLKDRTQAPATASSNGLYFVGADYQSEYQKHLPSCFAPPLWLSHCNNGSSLL